MSEKTNITFKDDYFIQKQKEKKNMADEFMGIILSLITQFIWTINSICLKFFLNKYEYIFQNKTYLFPRGLSTILISLILGKIQDGKIHSIYDFNPTLFKCIIAKANLSFFAMCFWTVAVSYLRITTCQVISSLSPILIITFSVFLLKEEFHSRYILGIICGIVGSVIIILDEKRINRQIEIEYCGKNIRIETKDRRVFTNDELDYTCIEILDTDNIKKFFNIDKTIFEDKNSLIEKEIFILQYPNGILKYQSGKILLINNNMIEHSVSTEKGSSGSPLIKRYNTNLIIGMHVGEKLNEDRASNESIINIAIPFDKIIADIIRKLSIKNYKYNEYRNIINLIYNKKNYYNYYNSFDRIFGPEFVENNKTPKK